ncbi:MAG TPA: DUF29 domain-containing protein [Beijerinckiaceae bacterium]|jgi:hypothetical protein
MDQPSGTPPGNASYERDFYAWTQDQAKAIEEGRWSEVDGANLAEEVRSLGRRLVEEVDDRLEILLAHLLKWRHLAEYRGMAWRENIDRQRDEIAQIASENPSFVNDIRSAVVRVYEDARRRLEYDTYYFPNDFPATCPFTVDQVLDPHFYPEDLDGPAAGHLPNAQSMA